MAENRLRKCPRLLYGFRIKLNECSQGTSGAIRQKTAITVTENDLPRTDSHTSISVGHGLEQDSRSLFQSVVLRRDRMVFNHIAEDSIHSFVYVGGCFSF